MTTGVASAISTQIYGSRVPIIIKDGTYTIEGDEYKWPVKEENFLAWTRELLAIFEAIEIEVNDKKGRLKRQGEPLEDSLTLTPERCHQLLTALADTGTVAYVEFFSPEVRATLADLLTNSLPPVFPTFQSELTLFPWELLYEGQDFEEGDPCMFWGLRYALARTLGTFNITKYVKEQSLPSRMLFCLHSRLREAHQREWPSIEGLVRATQQDRVELLGPTETLAHVIDGKTLLAHLCKGKHNIVHFACHADPGNAGEDVLRLSLINLADLLDITEKDYSTVEIRLGTRTFAHQQGNLETNPLVFLNACQTGGGVDILKEMYNLPRKFVERQAGAVIATACPVPDIFAAEFARVFYGYFLRGHHMLAEAPEHAAPIGPLPIGEALRLTRWYFIRKHHNPLGLAYGLYSPAHYRLAQAPEKGIFMS